MKSIRPSTKAALAAVLTLLVNIPVAKAAPDYAAQRERIRQQTIQQTEQRQRETAAFQVAQARREKAQELLDICLTTYERDGRSPSTFAACKKAADFPQTDLNRGAANYGHLLIGVNDAEAKRYLVIVVTSTPSGQKQEKDFVRSVITLSEMAADNPNKPKPAALDDAMQWIAYCKLPPNRFREMDAACLARRNELLTLGASGRDTRGPAAIAAGTPDPSVQRSQAFIPAKMRQKPASEVSWATECSYSAQKGRNNYCVYRREACPRNCRMLNERYQYISMFHRQDGKIVVSSCIVRNSRGNMVEGNARAAICNEISNHLEYVPAMDQRGNEIVSTIDGFITPNMEIQEM